MSRDGVENVLSIAIILKHQPVEVSDSLPVVNRLVDRGAFRTFFLDVIASLGLRERRKVEADGNVCQNDAMA